MYDFSYIFLVAILHPEVSYRVNGEANEKFELSVTSTLLSFFDEEHCECRYMLLKDHYRYLAFWCQENNSHPITLSTSLESHTSYDLPPHRTKASNSGICLNC